MAKREGLHGPILKKITMHIPAQFVALCWQAGRGGMGAVDTPFKDDDINSIGRQLASSQCRRESSANENNSALFQASSHDFLPLCEVRDGFRIGSTRELLATKIDHVLG